MKTYITFLLSVFLLSILSAQDHSDFSPLIINEIGLTTSGQQYIELLVIGNPESPDDPINLRDWIIDNQSSLSAGDSSFVRFGSCFSSILPGTLILIYDHQGKGSAISFAANGTPNSEGVYQLSMDDVCLEICDEGGEGSFECGPISSSKGWNDVLALSSSGDVLQIRSPDGRLQYALNWMGDQYEFYHQPQTVDFTPVGGGDIPKIPIELKEWCDHYDVIYDHSPTGSPGTYNSINNGNFIHDLASGTLKAPLSMQCQSVDNEQDTTSASIQIQGGVGSYTIQWSGPSNGSQVVTATGEHLIPNLLPGRYEITVSDARGCTKHCSFITIRSRGGTICEGECEEIGQETDYCFKWSPEEGLADAKSSVTEACPEETTTYTLTLTDDDGNLVGTSEYEVEVMEVEVAIEPDPGIICGGTPITLDAGAGFVSYEWVDDGGNILGVEPALAVSIAGTYTVNVLDGNGCSGSDDVEVFNGDNPIEIKQYFENYGYDCIPVSVDQLPPGLVGNGSVSRGNDIIISIEGNELNLSEQMDALLGQFTAAGYTGEYNFTDNEDFCNGTFEQVDELYQNSTLNYNIWIHIWENPISSDDDCIFIKQRINVPNNITDLPVNTSGYDDCSVGQNGIIYLDHRRALQMLEFAIQKLEEYDGVNPSCVKDALTLHFNGADSELFADFIRLNLRYLKFMASSFADYRCVPNGQIFCDSNSFAFAYPCIPFTNISLCDPAYFGQNDIDRSATIIHELTHKYGCNADLGYYWNGKGIDYQQNSTFLQTINADSYAELVKSIYNNC
ncbi:MAG: hypothetical protein AAGG75_20325 [Bacteroidota bacterium]